MAAQPARPPRLAALLRHGPGQADPALLRRLHRRARRLRAADPRADERPRRGAGAAAKPAFALPDAGLSTKVPGRCSISATIVHGGWKKGNFSRTQHRVWRRG